MDFKKPLIIVIIVIIVICVGTLFLMNNTKSEDVNVYNDVEHNSGLNDSSLNKKNQSSSVNSSKSSYSYSNLANDDIDLPTPKFNPLSE